MFPLKIMQALGRSPHVRKDLLPVLRLLGIMITFFAGLMGAPLGISLFAGDGIWQAYAIAAGIALAAGVALWALTQQFRRELLPRHGILLVPLTWTALPLFGSLPLMLAFQHMDMPLSFTNAYFEAVSGFSTSGATVLGKLDKLPVSINFWRTFLQWIGGMGLLVLAVAVMPLLGVGGSQLFKTEAAGPIKDNKLTPRIKDTAKGLWGVYALFSMACASSYWLAGMQPLDAVMHMFATVSLGGFSPHDASLGYFKSPLIEAIAIFFMLLASCNFALYFIAMRKRTLQGFWRDPEMRATITVLLGSGLLISAWLAVRQVYPPLQALRNGMFSTISVASTTGFVTVDYLQWPVFAPVFMLLLSGIATSAGSTGCGIKMVRVLILVQQARRELRLLVHPRAVQPVRIGNAVIPNKVIFAVLAYMLLYGATVLSLVMVMLLTDLDPVTAFSAVIASVHCMGPGMGAVGPVSNFTVLSDFQLWVCTLAMLLGRLELLSFLALLTPSFWRQ